LTPIVSTLPPYPLRPEPKLNEEAREEFRPDAGAWVSTFRPPVRRRSICARRLQTLAFAQLADKNPEAVMLDLVEPARPGGRTFDERSLARADETGRRDSRRGGFRAALLF
jgi:hypothetical protein